ncbi:MAG: hypothetical protein HYW37_01600 [Candidatus Colwellbacteria bacterium]|nr:hypothetical protein [Candidatus Colwellbacteria bacterium]
MLDILVHKVLADGTGVKTNPLIIEPPGKLPGDIVQLVANVSQFVLTIGLIVAPLMILWSAFLFLTAGGNEDQIKTAKRTFLYVVIGLVVLLLATGLPLVVKDILSGSSPAGGGGSVGPHLQ